MLGANALQLDDRIEQAEPPGDDQLTAGRTDLDGLDHDVAPIDLSATTGGWVRSRTFNLPAPVVGARAYTLMFSIESPGGRIEARIDLDNITMRVIGDGEVNAADLAILLGSWGPCPKPPDACPADLNGDGIVGAADLTRLLGAWTG